MKYTDLTNNISRKKSFLCVGLDTDILRIPEHLKKTKNPVFEFNKNIIDSTAKFTVAYKLNIAFYESLGIDGWKALDKTVQYIRENYPDIFIIADAKRGDIGNTSKMYAKTFFSTFDFDAVTVSPYMGTDSVEPFLTFSDKWVIILALTSNQGAEDFQYITDAKNKEPLYINVVKKSLEWGDHNNIMYVVGATKANYMNEIRRYAPLHFLLVPGIGAQGGSLEQTYINGSNENTGLLVNASRSIIYASDGQNFAMASASKAAEMQQQMAKLIQNYTAV